MKHIPYNSPEYIEIEKALDQFIKTTLGDEDNEVMRQARKFYEDNFPTINNIWKGGVEYGLSLRSSDTKTE